MRLGMMVLLLGLAACAAPVAKMYDGPMLAPSEQVIVRVESRGRTFAKKNQAERGRPRATIRAESRYPQGAREP